MEITIHRGSKEIGGTCMELSSGNTRLLIDCGEALSDDSKDVDLSKLSFDAVLISHPHMDHFGMIERLPDNVPVYMGSLGQKLAQATRLFRGKELLRNSFVDIEPWKQFSIGGIKITPYFVDHSAIDAYAFLIEAEGKRIFYSGDFRAHGRKGVLFEKMIAKPPADIDVLFMEGTMLARDNHEFPDEKAVEEKILFVLKSEQGPCFILSSSQNIDTIVSAYRASKRAGRVFVLDIYTAWILNEISKQSKNTPTIDWEDVRVLSKGWSARSHYLKVKKNPDYFGGFVFDLYKQGNVITVNEIAKEPGKYFIKSSLVGKLIENIECNHSSVIYSLWEGYLEEEYNPKSYLGYKDLREDDNVNFVFAHTSGHAVIEDLKRFADALSPKQLVPIHTEHSEKYNELFDQEVRLFEDGKIITV